MTVAAEVAKAIEWVVKHSAEQVTALRICLFLHVWRGCFDKVNAHRESTIASIEKIGKEMRRSGRYEDWANVPDKKLREAARGVNGPLLEFLAKGMGYSDAACIELFRSGAPLLGKLACTGNGTALREVGIPDLDLLDRECAQRWVWRLTGFAFLFMRLQLCARNREMLASLKEDENSGVLFKKTCDDALKGWMSEPRPLKDEDAERYVLSPRFCVEQGMDAEGNQKFRAVDDFTRSGVNAQTAPTEKLHCDTLDGLNEILRRLATGTKVPLSLFKTDIDSAFRRLRIRSDHRMYAHIVFKYKGVTYISVHFREPFGSVASVHAWDRAGNLLCAIARKMLQIPMSRYVDDYYAPDRAESAEIAMNCFVRLVRACLGHDAISEAKCGVGNPLVILGVEISLAADGATFKPSADKVAKW